MSKGKKRQSKKDNPGWSDQPKGGFNNPFAALSGSSPQKQSEPVGENTEAEPSPSLPKRCVIRHSRKGRGGKTVTLVSHLGLSADQLTLWCARLRKSMGCGGKVENDVIVLQGDVRDRVAEWFSEKGVGRVSTS